MYIILREGIKIGLRSMHVKFHGLKRYSGNVDSICKQIINECYDNKKGFFRASSENYKVFYSRDFGWCIESLLKLGYKTEVNNTLKYSLEIYSNNNRITVAINDKDQPFNFPNIYSPDSVAYMYRSLRIAKSKELIKKYRIFLSEQLKIFESEVIDERGMLKKKQFSGMRDHIKSKELCYDMIMACMLSDEVEKINELMNENTNDKKEFIVNCLKKYTLKENLIKNYWNKEYFIDSLSDAYCSGSVNVYPYYLDIITDKKMLISSIKSIQKNKLDKPLPLKYGYSKNTKFIWQDIFAHDWEKETSWAMLGLAYIDIISRVDKKKAVEYLQQYEKSIKKYQSFIEVYSENEPYSSTFYTSDGSMLWASMYLELKEKIKEK